LNDEIKKYSIQKGQKKLKSNPYRITIYYVLFSVLLSSLPNTLLGWSYSTQVATIYYYYYYYYYYYKFHVWFERLISFCYKYVLYMMIFVFAHPFMKPLTFYDNIRKKKETWSKASYN